MRKIIIIAILAFAGALHANGQYVQYDPMPSLPPPPVPQTVVQQNVVVTPPRYNTPNVAVKPTLNIFSEYILLSAKINGNDLSQHYMNAKASLAFYSYSNDPSVTYMAIVVPGENSGSYGRMSAVTNEETPQTENSYGRTTTVFAWDFMNTFDGTKGSASVTFNKEYRKEGTAFICKIQGSNGQFCDFTGILVK